MQNLAILGISVGVLDVALRAEEIAGNLMQDVCDIRNGDEWGIIAMNQHLRDMAPGMAGHFAWLVVIGNM